jgi:hypothetical protein
MRRSLAAAVLAACLTASAATAAAQDGQDTSTPHRQHQHSTSDAVALFPPREASGTAWLPDETPMYGIHRAARGWQVMFHGAVFGQYLYEPGDKHRTGGFANHQASSVNWFMAMARRGAGKGRLGLRAMLTVEPWTVGDCGFIDLLATGEMCEGDTIHDRQHPHDLFMEVAADYERPLRGSLRWQVYGGLAGEPALGPAGFPHRVSAMLNPVAPISHHWLDSSHITFGLITTALYDHRWKAEMSVFNGREPDDGREDIDLGPLDSVSGRLTLMPTPRWAVQISAAHLTEAEAEFPPEPRSDVARMTASATYHRLTATLVWATTMAYGLNSGPEIIPEGVVDLMTHAVLMETSVTVRERDNWFGRLEIAGKPGHDLHVHEAPATIFTVGKLQAGYVRQLTVWKGLTTGIGGTASLAFVPEALVSHYSRRASPGFGVFVSLRPSRHVM